ncbi:MAG: flagellar biosynthesis protein FlhB [Oceanospirillaceae bacterium]|nr:flagellar biosynthesis protein FlhB [Oceanospirillaceae bacterium]MCP5350063.1 flagellar biosynthesis protein FlhB [Oceanospirillaceae bacterium]
MADDGGQEKTEEPTGRRLEKAREEGQLPRSKELATSMVLIAGVLSVWVFGGLLYDSAERLARYNFVIEREALFDDHMMLIHLGTSAGNAILNVLPILAVLLVAAIAGPIALGGWNFSPQALLPKLDRLSPLAGLKRMFGVKSLIELLKAWAKVIVLGACSIILFYVMEDEFFFLNRETPEAAIVHATDLVMKCAIILCLSTLIIAAIDVPVQLIQFMQKMRMTLQEVKDEHKDTDGKPEVKSRIRRLQYEMSQRRMMQDVPKADVIITNPTHFAVALKYDADSMKAPLLLAKGNDEVAFKIREIAAAHKIPVLEAPALARAVYFNTKVGKEIPEGLYVAVAQVLAYIFQLDQYMKGRSAKPKRPAFPIPPELRV